MGIESFACGAIALLALAIIWLEVVSTDRALRDETSRREAAFLRDQEGQGT